jgi:hypothetical protein
MITFILHTIRQGKNTKGEKDIEKIVDCTAGRNTGLLKIHSGRANRPRPFQRSLASHKSSLYARLS